MGLKALRLFATTSSALLVSRNLTICKINKNSDIVKATSSKILMNLSTFKKAQVTPHHRGKITLLCVLERRFTTF